MASVWEADRLSMDNAAGHLLREIWDELTFSNGHISRKMGAYEFLLDALFGLLKHGFSIDNETLFLAFEESLRECFKQNQKLADAKKLIHAFDKRCAAILQKETEYVLITSISLKTSPLPRNRTINGCVVRFSTQVPRKYRKARHELIQHPNKIAVNSESDGYVFVEVRLRAPNDLTAFMRAMQVLDIYRGLWQLHLKKTINFLADDQAQRYSSNCTLRLGNLHTLHLGSGGAAKDAHWHEDQAYHGPAITLRGLPEADRRVGKLITKLNQTDGSYFSFCAKALNNYVSAIEKSDKEARFSSLWLCLELITGADDAATMIKRVAFFYAQQDVVKATLRSLRRARNSHVHAGVMPANIEIKNFKMCEFVEQLLAYLLHNAFKFSKPNEWQDFMSTTTSLESIDQQIAKLRLVKKFICPVAKTV